MFQSEYFLNVSVYDEVCFTSTPLLNYVMLFVYFFLVSYCFVPFYCALYFQDGEWCEQNLVVIENEIFLQYYIKCNARQITCESFSVFIYTCRRRFYALKVATYKSRNITTPKQLIFYTLYGER